MINDLFDDLTCTHCGYTWSKTSKERPLFERMRLNKVDSVCWVVKCGNCGESFGAPYEVVEERGC